MPTNFKQNNLHFHADDFGLLPQGDAAILELLSAGSLDGTSVMINRVSAENIVKLRELRRRRNFCLGLHLDAHGAVIPKIDIAKEECLSFIIKHGLSLSFSGRLRRQARLVWEKQIHDFYTKFGQVPDQLEAHQHRNFHPLLFPIICSLAIKYKIPKIRVGKKIAPWRYWRGCSRAYVINFLLWINRHQKKFKEVSRSCSTSGYVFSLDWIFPKSGKEKTRAALRELAAQPTEVIFHPAKSLPGQKEYPFLAERYEQYDFLQEFSN